MTTQKGIEDTTEYESKLEKSKTVIILDIVLSPNTFHKISKKIFELVDKSYKHPEQKIDLGYWLDINGWMIDYAYEHNWYILEQANQNYKRES